MVADTMNPRLFLQAPSFPRMRESRRLSQDPRLRGDDDRVVCGTLYRTVIPVKTGILTAQLAQQSTVIPVKTGILTDHHLKRFVK